MRNAIPTDAPVAADNACFSNPKDYSDRRFLAFLDRFNPKQCLFATAPDVVGNHTATIYRSIPMLKEIRRLGFQAAFCAQDGWYEMTAPWDDFDVLFIGGTTQFKLGMGGVAAKQAIDRGKKVHMGRVNSKRRLMIAVKFGCSSADGTFLKFGPDTNWPKLRSWLDYLLAQDINTALNQKESA